MIALPDPRPLKKVSPSQLANAELCDRKWYYGTVLGIRTPQGKGAEFGEKVHAGLAQYLLKGSGTLPEDPRILRTIKPGLPYIPPRASLPQDRIERKFELKIGLAVPVSGVIDWLWQDKLIVGDHKTLKDFQYMKTSAQLRKDSQSVSYVGEAHLEIGWPFPIAFRHVYYNTSRSEGEYTDYVYSQMEWEDQFAVLVGKVERLTKLATLPISEIARPAAKPGRLLPDACGAFGGCPFKDICLREVDLKASTKQIIASLFPEKKVNTTLERGSAMGFKDKLLAAQANQAQNANQQVASQPVVQQPVVQQPIAQTNQDVRPAYDPRQVNPTDGTPMNQAVAYTPKRGRPSKADIAAREAAVAAGQIPPPKTAKKEAKPVNTAKEYPFTVYVGCRPRMTEVYDLVEVLAEFQEIVCKDAGVPHYGLLDFGAGNKRVAALVYSRLQEEGHEWLPEHITADRRFPGTDSVLEVLFAYKDENQVGPFIVEKLA